MHIRGHAAAFLLLSATTFAALPSRAAPGEAGAATATYRVRVADTDPLRLAVTATLPAGGDRLIVADSRPGGIPALDADGWPAIFTGLRVTGSDGADIAAIPAGATGWRLASEPGEAITVHYEVDYAALAAAGWPAPRESAYADADAIVLAGRALFVATPSQGASLVAIDAPAGWHAAAPWPAAGDAGGFRAASRDDLFDNLVALSRAAPETIVADGMAVAVVATGDWRPVRADVRDVVVPMARAYTGMMPPAAPDTYLVVLLPQRERGGESFRNSFAMNVDQPPSADNRASWGATLAHELFHYWNGWRLRGSDYAATQWFQEGFTEYMADKSMLSAGLLSADDFLAKLSRQVADARRLETPPDAPGTRKGPPLYAAGALIALSIDLAIRGESGDTRSLEDLFSTLWHATGRGARPYDWDTIREALQAIAPQHDWAAFHARHVAGRDALPLEQALHALGLRLEDTTSGSGAGPRVVPDAAASPAAQARWRGFVAR